MRKQCKRKRILKYQKRKANKMQAEILSFDEVLDKIKSEDIDRIYFVSLCAKDILSLDVLNANFLAYYRHRGFFIKVTEDGE